MKKQWFFLIAILTLLLAACTQTPNDEEVPENNLDEQAPVEENQDLNDERNMDEQRDMDEQRNMEEDNNLREDIDGRNEMNENDNDRPTSTEKSRETDNADTNFKLSPEDAYDVYLEKFPNTKVREVKLDRQRNTYVYQIKGFDAEKEYEVKIDPNSGAILADRSKNKPNNHQEIPRERLTNVPNLVAEALVDAGEGAMLDEWEVDYDHGMIELDIEIDLANGRDVDYKYNLDTGELIKKS